MAAMPRLVAPGARLIPSSSRKLLRMFSASFVPKKYAYPNRKSLTKVGRKTEVRPSARFLPRSFLSVPKPGGARSEEHTSELQSRLHLVCRLLLEKKKNNSRMK